MITWQQGNTTPENAENFATISQWWTNLNGKAIAWRQRIIPESGNVRDLNWETQQFDEKFTLIMPSVGGITLYWYKPDSEEKRSTTPVKLELDPEREQLYIYPQSQKQLVIRVARQDILYKSIELKNPQVAGKRTGDQCILLLRDSDSQLEVSVTLTAEKIQALKQILL